MKLEKFYESPERMDSEEVSLARGWTSAADPGATFSLYWVSGTGEVCALRHGPIAIGPGAPKPYGVYFPTMRSSGSDDQEILILGTCEHLADVRSVVDGAGESRQTLDWLRGQLDSRGR